MGRGEVEAEPELAFAVAGKLVVAQFLDGDGTVADEDVVVNVRSEFEGLALLAGPDAARMLAGGQEPDRPGANHEQGALALGEAEAAVGHCDRQVDPTEAADAVAFNPEQIDLVHELGDKPGP